MLAACDQKVGSIDRFAIASSYEEGLPIARTAASPAEENSDARLRGALTARSRGQKEVGVEINDRGIGCPSDQVSLCFADDVLELRFASGAELKRRRHLS